MSAALDTLATAIAERRALLFAGAGVGMSVGLPSWRDLMRLICRELSVSLDDEMAQSPASTYQTLAEYYRLERGGVEPLHAWMQENWRVDDEQIRDSRALAAIVALGFPLVYTTNYDHSLERAFDLAGKPYVRIVTPRDAAAPSEGATQIVKFHGDLDDARSLVFTEGDYLDRLAFDSPLDVKFEADALGRTVLFVGYSMSDPNVRLLLYRLWKRWRHFGEESARPRSYVFMPNPSRVQEIVLGHWGIDVVTTKAADAEIALATFLEDLLARVSALNGSAPGRR
jgi:hypothetical protein